MSTHKLLRQAAHRIRVHPVGAKAIRNSLQVRLASIATWGPDPAERQAAEEALRVLAAHQWKDSGFKALGIVVKQPPAPVVIGAVRLGEEGIAA